MIEKRFIVELQNCQVDARRDRFDARRNMARRLIGLHVNLACVFHHVRVGENTLAVDHHSGAFHLARCAFGPGPEQIGRLLAGVNLHDQVANRVLGVKRGGNNGAKANRQQPDEGSIHVISLRRAARKTARIIYQLGSK